MYGGAAFVRRKLQRASKPRAATAIDRAIGRQLSKRRVMLGMTKLDVANELGITRRQVQKYESGSNRISVSRLVQVAAVLNAPIGWFFKDLERNRAPESQIQEDALLGFFTALSKQGAQQKFSALLEWLTTEQDGGLRKGTRERDRRRRA